MIVETSSNQLFRVRDAEDYDHAWIGVEVKKTAAGYVPKAKAREVLVRKAATKIVEQ